MGNNSYSITALPAGVEENNPAELLKDLVHSAAELCGALGDEIAETLALSLAQSAAIRPGKPLTVEEMEAMMAALFSSESNRLTPDGKPILFILTDDELASHFKS